MARLVGHRLAARISHEFTEMARHTLEGQAMELGWTRDNAVDLTPTDYLEMVLRKTCWYTTMHPLRVGLLIGSLGSNSAMPEASTSVRRVVSPASVATLAR